MGGRASLDGTVDKWHLLTEYLLVVTDTKLSQAHARRPSATRAHPTSRKAHLPRSRAAAPHRDPRQRRAPDPALASVCSTGHRT